MHNLHCLAMLIPLNISRHPFSATRLFINWSKCQLSQRMILLILIFATFQRQRDLIIPRFLLLIYSVIQCLFLHSQFRHQFSRSVFVSIIALIASVQHTHCYLIPALLFRNYFLLMLHYVLTSSTSNYIVCKKVTSQWRMVSTGSEQVSNVSLQCRVSLRRAYQEVE